MHLRTCLALLVAGLLLAQQSKVPPATFNGTVHGVTSKQVTIENEAGNLLDFDVSRKTRIVRDKKQIPLSQLESGDVVAIEARQVMGRFLEAVSITVQAKPKD
jgi:Cu/Ag efflux protein CusF